MREISTRLIAKIEFQEVHAVLCLVLDTGGMLEQIAVSDAVGKQAEAATIIIEQQVGVSDVSAANAFPGNLRGLVIDQLEFRGIKLVGSQVNPERDRDLGFSLDAQRRGVPLDDRGFLAFLTLAGKEIGDLYLYHENHFVIM
jgi:hypothetical protein